MALINKEKTLTQEKQTLFIPLGNDVEWPSYFSPVPDCHRVRPLLRRWRNPDIPGQGHGGKRRAHACLLVEVCFAL